MYFSLSPFPPTPIVAIATHFSHRRHMVVLKSYEIYHYTVKYVSDRYSTHLQASCSSHTISARTLMFLNRNRLHHALSSFNHVTHHWAAIPLCDPHDSITQRPSSHPADAIGKQS